MKLGIAYMHVVGVLESTIRPIPALRVLEMFSL